MTSFDVVVVGGGIIGLSCARAIQSSGHSVAVIDPHRDDASSLAAAGMLAPISEAREIERPLLEISKESLALWPEFAESLAHDTGRNLDFRTNGTLNVALDADHHRSLQHMKAQHDALGIETRFLNAEETLELEPGLSPRVFSSLFCEHERQVNPRSVIAALKLANDYIGVTRMKSEVQRVTASGVVLQYGDEIDAKAIVIAGGAWSPTIEGLQTPPPIRPVRGQMVHVKSDEMLCDRPIRTPDVYLVPRSNGSIVIGSTMEDVGYDLSQTFGGIAEIMRDAWDTLPGLYDATFLGTWSGLRPISFSNFPHVGADLDQENLFYATGHGRGGILLTPWTVQKISEVVNEFLG